MTGSNMSNKSFLYFGNWLQRMTRIIQNNHIQRYIIDVANVVAQWIDPEMGMVPSHNPMIVTRPIETMTKLATMRDFSFFPYTLNVTQMKESERNHVAPDRYRKHDQQAQE